MGKKAVLHIPLPALLEELSFAANVKPFLVENALEQQEIWLLANEQAIASWVLREGIFTTIRWQVDAAALASNPAQLELQFIIPTANTPHALGAGSDLRELGLAFTTISITGPAEATQ